jgi:hypothetical protein
MAQATVFTAFPRPRSRSSDFAFWHEQPARTPSAPRRVASMAAAPGPAPATQRGNAPAAPLLVRDRVSAPPGLEGMGGPLRIDVSLVSCFPHRVPRKVDVGSLEVFESRDDWPIADGWAGHPAYCPLRLPPGSGRLVASRTDLRGMSRRCFAEPRPPDPVQTTAAAIKCCIAAQRHQRGPQWRCAKPPVAQARPTRTPRGLTSHGDSRPALASEAFFSVTTTADSNRS